MGNLAVAEIGRQRQHVLRDAIAASLADNAFVRIEDIDRAQALADTMRPDELHRHLDRYAKRFCPVADVFGQAYHLSLMQVEYSTDLIFRSEATLKSWYESPSRLSRQLHRLRALGLIKRVTRSYRYYLTRLGRSAIAAACSLTQFQIIPALAHAK